MWRSVFQTAGLLNVTDSGVSDHTQFWPFLHLINEMETSDQSEIHTHTSKLRTSFVYMYIEKSLYTAFGKQWALRFSGANNSSNVLCVTIDVGKVVKLWQAWGFCLHFLSFENILLQSACEKNLLLLQRCNPSSAMCKHNTHNSVSHWELISELNIMQEK